MIINIDEVIVKMHTTFYKSLLEESINALPKKLYGLIGGRDILTPLTIYPCNTNLRNNPEWAAKFASYGEFYYNLDRGFVISPEEFIRINKKMKKNGEIFVGVFHSHRCTSARPSQLDIDFHYSKEVFAYIISVVNQNRPVLKIFQINPEKDPNPTPGW